MIALTDRYGTPGGPLVIAFHGAVANRKTWLPLAAALPPEFEVWCPDLPGHGSRSDEPFVLERALKLAAQLVAEAGDRDVLLAGDSLGGYIALLAAARAGDGVAAVCAGGCTWTMHGLHGALARASDIPGHIAEGLFGDERLAGFAERLLTRACGPAVARAIVAAKLRFASRSESLRELAGLDLCAVVRTLHMPIVYVNGARDWPTRQGEGSLLRATPHASVAIAPKVGHGVGLLAPAFFARTITEAMQRARAERSDRSSQAHLSR